MQSAKRSKVCTRAQSHRAVRRTTHATRANTFSHYMVCQQAQLNINSQPPYLWLVKWKCSSARRFGYLIEIKRGFFVFSRVCVCVITYQNECVTLYSQLYPRGENLVWTTCVCIRSQRTIPPHRSVAQVNRERPAHVPFHQFQIVGCRCRWCQYAVYSGVALCCIWSETTKLWDK